MAVSDSVNTIVATNSKCAVSAAFLEAGRITNKQASKLVAKKLPLMFAGYADTPVGRLVIANLVQFAVQQYYGADNGKITKLTNAMLVTSYQEVLATFKLEEMLEELFSSKLVTQALHTTDEE